MGKHDDKAGQNGHKPDKPVPPKTPPKESGDGKHGKGDDKGK